MSLHRDFRHWKTLLKKPLIFKTFEVYIKKTLFSKVADSMVLINSAIFPFWNPAKSIACETAESKGSGSLECLPYDSPNCKK